MAYTPTINDIRDITPLLTSKLHFDYSNFGFTFLKRRLSYVFDVINIKKVQQFTDGINDGSLLEDIKYHFPIPATELFRDPSFWRALKNKIATHPNQEELIFWFPELTSGEELYSLVILLENLNCRNKIKIICNVESNQKRDEIKNGFLAPKNKELNRQNIKRVNQDLVEETFISEKDGNYSFNKELLNNIEYIPHNYFTNAPDNQSVYMAIFRNNLLNYNLKLQTLAEQEIYQSIKEDSFLALGINERISSDNSSLYSLHDKNESIYQII